MKLVRIGALRRLVGITLLTFGLLLISSSLPTVAMASDSATTQIVQSPVDANAVPQYAESSSSDDDPEQVGGRCGFVGQGRITIRNDTRTTVYIEVRNRDRFGNVGQDFRPGTSRSWSVCNRDDVVLRVSTATECGRTFIGESRSIRVYDQEAAILGGSSFRFDRADWTQVASTAAGFALTYIAQGYGVPPQVLEKLGVREASLYRLCGSSTLSDLAQCAVAIYRYIPSDVYNRFSVDRCSSQR